MKSCRWGRSVLKFRNSWGNLTRRLTTKIRAVGVFLPPFLLLSVGMHNQSLVSSGYFTVGIAEAFQLTQYEEGCNGVDTGQDQREGSDGDRSDSLPGGG